MISPEFRFRQVPHGVGRVLVNRGSRKFDKHDYSGKIRKDNGFEGLVKTTSETSSAQVFTSFRSQWSGLYPSVVPRTRRRRTFPVHQKDLLHRRLNYLNAPQCLGTVAQVPTDLSERVHSFASVSSGGPRH